VEEVVAAEEPPAQKTQASAEASAEAVALHRMAKAAPEEEAAGTQHQPTLAQANLNLILARPLR
jgi:hypothetical protein